MFWIVRGIVGFEDVELVGSTLKISGVEFLFGSEDDVDAGGLLRMETAKGGGGIVFGEDWLVVDGGDESTTDFVVGSFEGGEETGGTGVFADVRDENAIAEVVAFERETEGRISAGDLEGFGKGVGKGIGAEKKAGDGSFGFFGWERGAVVGALKVLDIRWDFVDRKVIHTFIKTGMFGNFNALGIHIIPKNVAGGVGKETKKDAFARVRDKFRAATARGANPDTTTKGAEVGEIVGSASGKKKR